MSALVSALGLCVYTQTVAGLDTHKWAKVKRKAGEAMLNQPSEIAVVQKPPQGKRGSR